MNNTNDIAAQNTCAGNAAHFAGSINAAPPADDLANIAAALAAEDEAFASSAQTLEERLDRLKRVQDGRAAYEEMGHKRTYRMLQLAYSDLLYMRGSKQGEDEFARAAQDRQVVIDLVNGNFYLSAVKVMWGTWRTELAKVTFESRTDLVRWEHSRSAEKYAYVFRHLDEKNVPVGEVAAYIEKHTLNGIIEEDIRDHRKPGTSLEDHVKQLAELEPFASFEKPEAVKADEGVVFIAARVERGQLHLLGEVSISEAQRKLGLRALLKARNTARQRTRTKALTLGGPSLLEQDAHQHSPAAA